MAEKVMAQSGKYAWAIFDESLKAPLDLVEKVAPKDQSQVEEIASRTAPQRTRPDVLDGKLKELQFPKNMHTLGSSVLLVGKENAAEIDKRFHDFTVETLGLLTDTAKGGLKRDLTSIFESTTLPTDAFPAANSTFVYPQGFSATDGALRWNYLWSHYNKYKTISAASGEPIYKPSIFSDLKININGTDPSPTAERLIPVIAKFQLVFSLVTHDIFNIDNGPSDPINQRRKWWDTYANPKGYKNYGVPHLVYDPVITLYNPYDVTLDLTKTRVRMWDPPVGFRFKKVDKLTGEEIDFRDPTDKFWGLAQLNGDWEADDNARKCFTLVMADGTPSAMGNRLLLKPGEVKVFSPRVHPTWNYGQETSTGYSMGAGSVFFDWKSDSNFGNVDARSPSGNGRFGIESVPGWDVKAGLQLDHLSFGGHSAPRPDRTRYSFEKAPPFPRWDGWIAIKKTDDVVVECKPLVRSGSATAAQFQVDMLAGIQPGNITPDISGDTTNSGVKVDTLRSYKFTFSDAQPVELEENPAAPKIIRRKFNVGAILQPDSAASPQQLLGFKKPFAMLEMTARTTKGGRTDTKPWLYNNFVVEGGQQKSSEVGLAMQSYDLRFVEMSSFDGFPLGIDIDPDTKRGYFGADGSVGEGSSFVNMLHVPMAPSASMGDLIHANLASGSTLPRVVHPFGNSRAHPLVDVGRVSSRVGAANFVDHSYLLNDGLWDSYYFSSIAEYTGASFAKTRSLEDVMRGVLEGRVPALNSRIVPVSAVGDPKILAKTLSNLDPASRGRQLAKYVGINGPFNVNSTSVDAWRAFLSSLRGRAIHGLKLSGTGLAQTLGDADYSTTNETPFVRSSKPLSGPSASGGERWSAFRTLTDKQIEDLAKSIVQEITLRGQKDGAPLMTVGEFANRRLGAGGDLHAQAGLLQTAIDKLDGASDQINEIARRQDSDDITSGQIVAERKKGAANLEVLNGKTAEGAPTTITQGDLMAALAPVVTVRGDTFKIRSYGEALAPNGTTVLARAWCEVIVQRLPEFVDPVDAPETEIDALTSSVNRTFGRRFEILSFRWLSDKEV